MDLFKYLQVSPVLLFLKDESFKLTYMYVTKLKHSYN